MSKKVGERIRQFRDMRGLSQENVADEIGMSHGNFGKIERGVIDVSAANMIAIARVLKVPPSEFFEDKPKGLREIKPEYGYATRDELALAITAIQTSMHHLAGEVEKLRHEISTRSPRSRRNSRQTGKK